MLDVDSRSDSLYIIYVFMYLGTHIKYRYIYYLSIPGGQLSMTVTAWSNKAMVGNVRLVSSHASCSALYLQMSFRQGRCSVAPPLTRDKQVF